MPISIFQKIRAYCAAKRDSKGAYSSYFTQWQTEGGDFMLSAFMDNLVIGYSKKCIRKMSHCRYFQKMYAQILEQCGIMDEQLKQYEAQKEMLQDKIEEADSKIRDIQAQAEKLKNDWNSTNDLGKIPPESGASSVKELKMMVDAAEKEFGRLTMEREQLKEEKRTVQRALEESFRRESTRLEKLILSYRNRINHLHRKFKALANRQDEILVYYWHVLCEQMEKQTKLVAYEQAKSFKEICRLRDTQLIERGELFSQEREEIKKRTSHYPGFEIEA